MIYFVGDIHGELRRLVNKAVCEYGIKDSSIFVLGDFGAGFDNSLAFEYQRVKTRLENNNLQIYAIRGNHDNPEFFTGDPKYNFPRLHLVPDYTLLDIEDTKIWCIGGASSVDVEWRMRENATNKYGRKCWWPGERPKQTDMDTWIDKTDIIISHDAPISFDPVLTRLDMCPEWQYKNIIEDREYLQKILVEVRTGWWFFGHHHNSYSGSNGSTRYRGLNILEFYEYRKNDSTSDEE